MRVGGIDWDGGERREERAERRSERWGIRRERGEGRLEGDKG